jgi:hypothetical protein
MAAAPTRTVAVCVLVLLQSVCLTGAVLLVVTFPEANVDNYSVVALRCAKNNAFLDPLDSAQLPATFLRDGQMITSDSTLVTVTGTGADTLSFQFTQEQEGMFRCRTELNEESDPESLAAWRSDRQLQRELEADCPCDQDVW